MSAEPVGEPTRRTDGDVLARLTAIDHRLHQILTHLTAVDQLSSQFDEIRTNLETLIGSAGDSEVQALVELLAQVVELAQNRAVFPSRWAEIAEQAMEHGCVRHAVRGLSGPHALPRNGDGR